jgi:hypothetical protein
MDTKQAELELTLIKQMMADSRRVVADNGWHYIFWGVVVTSALIANYIMALQNVSMNTLGMMWFIAMISSAIIEGIVGRRREVKSKVKTFAGKLLGSLWTASGLSMFMLGFVGTLTGAYNPIYICSLISIVLGVAYYTSGAIQQIKWLQWLSLGWWAGAVFTFIYPSIHTLLIFAIMMVCFQVIPGIILYKKWKDANLEM